MTSALLIATLLMAPAPESTSVPFLVYDRASDDRREIPERFLGPDATRTRWSEWLGRWGCQPLGSDDTAWMVDCPFTVNIEWIEAACGGEIIRAEKCEQPQETMWPKDRGVWRSYLLVLRGGGVVELKPGLGLRVNPLGPRPDYCVTVMLPEK